MGEQVTGVESHDPDYPEKLLLFMRNGWGASSVPVNAAPEAARYAARREALTAAFPGETLVIPTGRERIRANDTLHPFRPGTDFAYLTGEHDPDAVLVLPASGDPVLYARP